MAEAEPASPKAARPRWDFGRALGGEQTLHPVEAGHYGASMHSSYRFYITMERVISGGKRSKMELRLEKDGRARLCVESEGQSSYSVSKYASRDGEDHHEKREDSMSTAWHGRWSPAPDGHASLEFDRVSYHGCDAKPVDLPHPYGAECHELRGSGPVPELLACRGDAPDGLWAPFAMLLDGRLEREQLDIYGAVKLDLQHAGPRAPVDEGEGWWLVAPAPGLEIESRKPRDREPVKLRIEARAAEAPAP